MTVWGMILGAYPRSRLARYTLRDRERGILDYTQYTSRLLMIHSEIIGVQKAHGLPVVVDGMVDWHDIFRPFIKRWKNVSIDGLLRYFDNNFFYRIPVFTGEPDPLEPVWLPRIRQFKNLAEPSSLKIVLPGPFTFVNLSQNASDLSKTELAESITSILKSEIELVKEESVFIQVDEPLVGDRRLSKEEVEEYLDYWNEIASLSSENSAIAIYFDAPRKEVFDIVLESKFKYVSVDVIDSKRRAIELLEKTGLPGHVPVLGIVDARRIHEDSLDDELLTMIKKLSKESHEIVLTTTTWLDLIPYTYALKKTKILSKFVDIVSEKIGLEKRILWR